MTRPLPERVQRVAELVVEQAGNYLRNTIREPGVTCTMCSAPVDRAGTALCGPCALHSQAGAPLADRVASLIYAVEYDSQAYKLVRGYKADAPGPSMADMMSSLLAIALRGHGMCDIRLSGSPDSTGWAVVPSTRRRDRPQPLRELLLALAKPGREVVITPAERLVDVRDLHPENFNVSDSPEYQHVILIDDSWVRGGHAQSAASALKSAGVASVSILTVARVLSPNWSPNVEFLRTRLRDEFDPRVCPWTGGACP